jgi:hypothetical protein
MWDEILVTARDSTVCPHSFPSLPEIPRSQAGTKVSREQSCWTQRILQVTLQSRRPRFPATAPGEQGQCTKWKTAVQSDWAASTCDHKAMESSRRNRSRSRSSRRTTLPCTPRRTPSAYLLTTPSPKRPAACPRGPRPHLRDPVGSHCTRDRDPAQLPYHGTRPATSRPRAPCFCGAQARSDGWRRGT